jgi:hypothetical protein
MLPGEWGNWPRIRTSGGADVGAEPQRPQPHGRGDSRGRGGADRHHGLDDVVVGGREVDHLAALVGNRELAQRGIEGLVSGCHRSGERHPHPSHPIRRVTEPLGDGERECRLESAPVGGIVVDVPRRVGRLIGGEDHFPGLQGGQCATHTVGPLAGGPVVAAAGGAQQQRGNRRGDQGLKPHGRNHRLPR